MPRHLAIVKGGDEHLSTGDKALSHKSQAVPLVVVIYKAAMCFITSSLTARGSNQTEADA